MIRTISANGIYEKLTAFIQSEFGTPSPDHLMIVEIGPLEEFQQAHIAGALHLAPEQLEAETPHYFLNKGTEIVVYAAQKNCELACDYARKLNQLGFNEVFFYPAGKEDWISRGL